MPKFSLQVDWMRPKVRAPCIRPLRYQQNFDNREAVKEFGTIVGSFIIGVLDDGMSIMGISVDWQQTIKGMVLLFAVAFDFYTKRRSGR